MAAFTASTQARHVFGMPQGEPGWKTEAFWHLVHRDDAARISDSVTAVQDGRAPFQAEHRIIRPDGSLRWVLQSAVVERDGTGAPSRMLGICLDITDRKRTEDRDPRRGRLQPQPDRGQPGPAGDDQPGGQDHRRERGDEPGDRGGTEAAGRHRLRGLLHRAGPGQRGLPRRFSRRASSPTTR